MLGFLRKAVRSDNGNSTALCCCLKNCYLGCFKEKQRILARKMTTKSMKSYFCRGKRALQSYSDQKRIITQIDIFLHF